MFSAVIYGITTAINACFDWMSDIFDSIDGSLPFVIFFVLLSAFLLRVLPNLVSSSGKSDKVKSSSKSKKSRGDKDNG